jgi:hypothetical protein
MHHAYLRLETIRIQIKSIDSISVLNFKPNRTECQETKSLNFRFGLSSFDLKSTEIDRKEYIQRRWNAYKMILRCVVNKYVYMHVLYTACARDEKIFFCAAIIELNRSFSKLLEFWKSDENWAQLRALKLYAFEVIRYATNFWCSWCSY